MRKEWILGLQHVTTEKTNLNWENTFCKVLGTKEPKGRIQVINVMKIIWLCAITTQVHVACSTQQLYSLSILGNTIA